MNNAKEPHFHALPTRVMYTYIHIYANILRQKAANELILYSFLSATYRKYNGVGNIKRVMHLAGGFKVVRKENEKASSRVGRRKSNELKGIRSTRRHHA